MMNCGCLEKASFWRKNVDRNVRDLELDEIIVIGKIMLKLSMLENNDYIN